MVDLRQEETMAPRWLQDPDGEGIYLRHEGTRGYMEAASIFGVNWRELSVRHLYMDEGPDELWRPARRGFRLGLRLLVLPRRWQPELYGFYTLKEVC